MAGVSVHIPPAAMELTPFDEEEMKATRMKRRVYDVLNKAAQKPVDRYVNAQCQIAPCSKSSHSSLSHSRLSLACSW